MPRRAKPAARGGGVWRTGDAPPSRSKTACTGYACRPATRPHTDASLTLFYDPSEAEPDNRIERLIMGPSEVHVAGGSLHPFARLTKRPLENVWAYDGTTEFTDLHLEQLNEAFDPGSPLLPGKL